MSKKIFLFALGVLLSVGLLWSVSPQKANSQYADTSCAPLSGVSGYASDPDSGVMDFDYGDYATGEDREVDGSLISDDDKTCVADSGSVTGYAWNPNAGWLQMDWCLGSVCFGLGQTEMDTGTGYWSGYAWSDKIGWVLFDWTCSPGVTCDITKRVYTDFDTGFVSGYAWNDRIGWIWFGGGTVTQAATEISVIPSVTITPDPLTVTKYGLGDGEAAPYASGEDGQEYVMTIQLYDAGTGELLNDTNYDVTIEITSTSDSYLCYDQISQECRENADIADDTEAIYYPDAGVATYGANDEGWQRSIRAFAPTSNMNGYDEDGDGVIDFYFDVESDGVTPSDSINQFALSSISLTVTPKGTGPDVTLSENDSLFNLDDDLGADDEYTLKFAPAMEVSNLERVQSGGSFTPYISSAVDVEQEFKGLVARWTSFPLVEDGFEVKAILQVDSAPLTIDGMKEYMYSFLFNRDELLSLGETVDYETTYVDPASQDANVMTNLYTISGTEEEMTAMCTELTDFDKHTTRDVPGTCEDGIVTLEAGSPVGKTATSGELIGKAEIVATSGTAGGGLSSPQYRTQVLYSFNLTVPGTKITRSVIVKYYSNYLPQQSSDTGYQEDITVSGSITSATGQETDVVSSEDIVVIGDISTIEVRNELFRRFSEYTKGVTPPGSGDEAIVSGDFEDESGKGVELLDGGMLYYKDVDEVRIQTDGSSEKTIVVYGGDIVIEENLTDFGLIVFKDNLGNGGNIRILNTVTDLNNGYIFAEGSVFSYASGYELTDAGYTDWGDSDTRAQELRNQLYFRGSLVSQNTIFGAGSGVLPDGTTTSDLDEATEYDLNELREFTLCWEAISASGEPVDTNGNGYTSIDGVPDMEDVEDCPGAERASNISDSSLEYYNAPVYCEYTPPPSSLPLLGESQAGSLNVF